MIESSLPAEAGNELRDKLIRLLESDSCVRRLVVEIAGSPSLLIDTAPEPEPEPAPAPVGVRKEAPQDPLREQLGVSLMLLETLRADVELQASWLIEGENEGQQLTRLLATASQWERLLELWEVLAERCKSHARPATEAELQLLKGCLSVHNLIWRDRQAQLCHAEVGAEYDYRLHQRKSHRGEIITAQWLPGLANADSERQCPPVVATE